MKVVGEQVEEYDGLTAAELELLQIRKVKQLMGHVPGFSSVASDSAGFGDILSVRGTANTTFFGSPGVGLMIDDVPYGDVFTYPTDFFDLTSATLHKGPQGAFFGRNGAGGMLELRTLGPSETATYRFTTEYGSYDSYGARFRASGPINEAWSYSFQSYYNQREGYIDNVTLQTDVDERERFGALANLYYRPSDDLEVRFRAMVETARDGGQRLSPLPISPSFIDRFTVGSDLLGQTDLDRYQFSLHIAKKLPWATAKSITSYQHWDLGPNTVDLDFSFLNSAASTVFQDQTLWTQEFRLESNEEEAFHWQAGLFFLHKEGDGNATRQFPLNPMDPTNTIAQTTIFDREEDQFAIYGNARWDASERLTFEAGARLEYVKTTLNRNKTGFVFGPSQFGGEASDWLFSPTFGASYELNEHTTLFARTSLGVKPQGFTAFSDDPTTFAYQDETSWETEIGVLVVCPDERWDFELRGFYKNIDDYQLSRSSLTSTDFIVVNAEEVTAIGVEAEANWRPVDQLTIFANAGWSEVEFDRFNDPVLGNLSGNHVPFIPEFTASLGFRYDFANGVFFSSALRSVGTTYFDDQETAAFRQSSYNVVDAQLGYEAENWSAVVFARNIFDEDYYTFINPQIAAGAPGDPATVGLRVSLIF